MGLSVGIVSIHVLLPFHQLYVLMGTLSSWLATIMSSSHKYKEFTRKQYSKNKIIKRNQITAIKQVSVAIYAERLVYFDVPYAV